MNTSPEKPDWLPRLVRLLGLLSGLIIVLVVGVLATLVLLYVYPPQPTTSAVATASIPHTSSSPAGAASGNKLEPAYWRPPDEAKLPGGPPGELIRYGRDLVAHTAKYFGPSGSVLAISNGMNCQNCHLEAGTKVLANNYSAVFSTYPKFRERSGTNETIIRRITDCFERSLNGKAPDSASREMQAMVVYMQWLGSDVPKGDRPKGAGVAGLTYLDRAASPAIGKAVYAAKCQSCHGPNGKGVKALGAAEYSFPPLWGTHSYNDGAGLYRLSNFAGYVKNNMPFGVDHQNPLLTDEECWDVAAYVNSMPRPHKDQQRDWPKVKAKPIDFPFAPYADRFSAQQHKLGPYGPIAEARKAQQTNAPVNKP